MGFGFKGSGSSGAANIDVLFNSVLEGSANATIPLNVNLTDGVSDIVPTSVGLTGNDLNIVIPTPIIPSGVAFQQITPSQYTSYRTGDEGWRVQNGGFNYIPPSTPKVVAELDFSSPNFFFVLKNPLVVNGISSTARFVDVNGVQIFSAVNNANLVIIDKLTGRMYTRNLPLNTTWNGAIDDALTYSIIVNGITYDDWHLLCLNEFNTLMDGTNNINLLDTQTSITIMSLQYCYTSTTFSRASASAYYYETKSLRIIDKTTFGSMFKIYVRNAQNLISAP